MANQEESKPVEILRNLPSEQSAAAPAVVLAPHLPAMEKIGEVKTVLRNTLLPLMGAGVQQTLASEGRMAPIPPNITASSPTTGKPQEPKAGQVDLSSAGGYIRMELHVENGRLSITGAKSVPGPLIIPSAVIRGYVYEVLLDEQQVALGSLPDVGLRRAFANRDVPGPEGKHYFINVPTFDFFVRIPKGHFLTANLPKLNVILHKVEDAPDRLTSLAPLQKQPGVKTVEVGRLTGIKPEQLSSTVVLQLEQILRETEKLQ